MTGNQESRGQLELLVLSVLSQGPGHGYLIIKLLKHRSNGAFDLPEGTVYPALRRLEELGWITSAWEDHGGRRRRTYSLSDAGQEVLHAQQAEWVRFAAGVNSVIGWSTT